MYQFGKFLCPPSPLAFGCSHDSPSPLHTRAKQVAKAEAGERRLGMGGDEGAPRDQPGIGREGTSK